MILFSNILRKRNANHERRVRQRAEDLYQIAAREGQLWLTHNGVYILPESMLEPDALTVVNKLRERYIKEHL